MSLNDAVEGEQVPKAHWATTFRVLGDVVHLIQDMGQPQHTREIASKISLIPFSERYQETIHA